MLGNPALGKITLKVHLSRYTYITGALCGYIFISCISDIGKICYRSGKQHQPVYFSTWVEVFRDSPRKLLDEKNFVIKYLTNQPLAEYVCQSLLKLLDATDMDNFDDLLLMFLELMSPSEKMGRFGYHSMNTYSKKVDQWVIWHYDGLGINIDMATENFHWQLKHSIE